jgi:hypothetical protein
MYILYASLWLGYTIFTQPADPQPLLADLFLKNES